MREPGWFIVKCCRFPNRTIHGFYWRVGICRKLEALCGGNKRSLMSADGTQNNPVVRNTSYICVYLWQENDFSIVERLGRFIGNGVTTPCARETFLRCTATG